MLAGGEKAELQLNDVREHHTDTSVSFSLKMQDSQLAEAMQKGLHKVLKLSSSVSTTNMTLFDERGRIVKHASAESILRNFYALRLSFYEKRKLHLSETLTAEWTKLDNKMRFILAVVTGAATYDANPREIRLRSQLQAEASAHRTLRTWQQQQHSDSSCCFSERRVFKHVNCQNSQPCPRVPTLPIPSLCHSGCI